MCPISTIVLHVNTLTLNKAIYFYSQHWWLKVTNVRPPQLHCGQGNLTEDIILIVLGLSKRLSHQWYSMFGMLVITWVVRLALLGIYVFPVAYIPLVLYWLLHKEWKKKVLMPIRLSIKFLYMYLIGCSALTMVIHHGQNPYRWCWMQDHGRTDES